MKFKQFLSALLAAILVLSVIPCFPAAAVSAGDSYTYTPSEHWGVTNDIWSWQWALADTEDFSDMKFKNISGQGDCYVADWDKYPYCAARKEGINMHPNENADAARVFTAPASGWVTVSATVARDQLYDPYVKRSPTTFRILLESTTVYPTVGNHRLLTSNIEETITCQVFVKAGEKLRFVVGAMNDHSGDALNLQTTVRYDSVTTNPGEMCRVGEAFPYTMTDATWGQPDPHWDWEWTPAGKTDLSPMTYQYVERYSKYMFASDWTTNPYNYVDQLGVKVHPAEAADTVKTFTVPYTGTVKLATEVARYTDLSGISNAAANGTSLRVLVNDTQVYPLYSDTLVLTSTTAKNFDLSLPVTAGDKIRIVVGSMGQTTSDALKMYNTVTYTSVDTPVICVSDGETFAPSTTQWSGNTMGNWSFEWRDADDTFGNMTYQYVAAQGKNLYTSAYTDQYADLLGVKLQPGQSRDTVKTYCVPCDGNLEMEIRVARYTQSNSTGNPTTLCVYKNDQQIWPTDGSQVQITSTSETTYRINADVQVGDKIRCVVGSMGDAANDEVQMYNTVTYRAVGTRELTAVADQYNQRIDVIDVWGDNLDSAETAWSWKPTKDLGFSSLDSFNSPTDAKIRYSQALKKYVVAVSASRGFMGVVDLATGKKIWQVTVTDESNPHSIEYLPNGNVAVAASKKHWVRIYTASQGSGSSTYAEAALEGAHGVLWDPERQLLWALGYSVITAYRIGGTDAKPTLTELTEYRANLPEVSAGGHDLSAVYGDNNKLWISSESVYLYDVNTKTFAQDYPYANIVARRGVKGVSSFPDTGTMVHVYPNNTYLEHDSDRFYVTRLEDGKFYGVTHSHSSGAYYKVRSWISTYQTTPRADIGGGTDPGVHNHVYISTVTAPTCTLSGYTTYTCTRCGDSYTDNHLPATGHSYKDTVTKEPTCTEIGYSSYVCTTCGGTFTINEVPATGHDYSYVITREPTCDVPGIALGTCNTCGDTKTEEVPTTTHEYQGMVIAPTCTSEGYTQNTCIHCGHIYISNRVPTTGHSYAVIVTKNPTCDTQGNMLYACSCGSSYNEPIQATGHSYQSQTFDPTCTDDGYTLHTCTVCGDSYEDNIFSAFGHSFVYGVCVTCGAEDPEYVPTYYLIGYINGADHGFEGDYENMGSYRFVDGKLTATFTQNSYVFLKTEGNTNWYMTNTYCTDTTATFHNTKTGAGEKMFVPGGVEITFTLTKNDDGTLQLSYATATPTVVTPTLTLKAPTLEFKDMITVNAMFEAADTQDVVEMGMITYSTKVSSWSIETAENVIPGTTYDATTGRYIACSQGIHAKYLGDTVYLACYAKLTDGTYVYSKLAGYSPVQYATTQLKGSDTKLKQLVVAMLNYGAEAQLYFGHNTGNLANATLSAEQKALPAAYNSGMVSAVASAPADKQGIFANNQGFSKRTPSISFEGAFSINYFFTPKYTPDSGITMYYWSEADYNAASVLTTSNATGKINLEGSGTGEYRGDITGIAAKALSEAVYVACAYKSGGTVWTSGVLGYSIGAYCSSQASKGTAISNLAMATAVYGYHAKAYFG